MKNVDCCENLKESLWKILTNFEYILCGSRDNLMENWRNSCENVEKCFVKIK